MTQGSGDLERGRVAVGRLAWAEGLAALSRADVVKPLQAADLQLLATAAYLRDDLTVCTTALQRAGQWHRNEGDQRGAARCLFWLGFILLHRGESAQAAGWFARATRHIVDEPSGCAEHGLLVLPDLVAALWRADFDAAEELAIRAIEIGARTDDHDLLSNALHFGGRARLRSGRIDEGLRWLDESMIAVVNGDVLPFVAGNLYCAMIEACAEISDLGRVSEWTDALTAWTEEQPELIIFSGDCLLHRAEILQLHGSWSEAADQAHIAEERLRRTSNRDAMGHACYRQAELHRVRGDLPRAEQAYISAGECGLDPQPGLALLRLAQGDSVGATEAIERVVTEASDPWRRVKVLPAHVTILLDRDDLDAARSSAAELTSLAAHFDSAFVHAVADLALGSVLVDSQDHRAALPILRRAAAGWRILKAPYEVALARVQIGRCCRGLNDHDGAAMEFDAARAAFGRLGAEPALDALTSLMQGRATHGLTGREVEVLKLIATGMTNRAVAEQLVLSERTVDRHLSNIFTKLQVSSRSAATAYVYQHRL